MATNNEIRILLTPEMFSELERIDTLARSVDLLPKVGSYVSEDEIKYVLDTNNNGVIDFEDDSFLYFSENLEQKALAFLEQYMPKAIFEMRWHVADNDNLSFGLALGAQEFYYERYDEVCQGNVYPGVHAYDALMVYLSLDKEGLSAYLHDAGIESIRQYGLHGYYVQYLLPASPLTARKAREVGVQSEKIFEWDIKEVRSCTQALKFVEHRHSRFSEHR